jgi:DNA-binding NtrC family response regulator
MVIRWSALIVDDDPSIRTSMLLSLEPHGARIVGVGTAAAALEALEREHFDVAFVDLWLGCEDGLVLLREILHRQPRTGVIVMTASSSSGRQRR